MSWSCPLCHAPLSRRQNSFICPEHHQFDVAKEGYINLLPVQYKRSKEPGDSAEMMQARRTFLNAGHYQPLRDEVCRLLKSYSPHKVLDIGCGEGYYTHAFAGIARQAFGLDVAKVAVRYAAKRYPQVQFCVASSQRLPFENDCMDAVVRIYAPCNPLELIRVVSPGGVVITVTPGPRHLLELKGLIYDKIHLHETRSEQLPGFSRKKEHSLAYPMKLNGSDAVALLQMTPFAWRAKPEVWETTGKKESFECQTDFLIQVWQREV